MALANLSHTISDTSVGNILKAHGVEPAPERKRQTTWRTFLQAPWDVLASIDFTTVEVWTKGRLVTFYLLFVMEIASRGLVSQRATSVASRDSGGCCGITIGTLPDLLPTWPPAVSQTAVLDPRQGKGTAAR